MGTREHVYGLSEIGVSMEQLVHLQRIYINKN